VEEAQAEVQRRQAAVGQQLEEAKAREQSVRRQEAGLEGLKARGVERELAGGGVAPCCCQLNSCGACGWLVGFLQCCIKRLQGCKQC
jgi:hypothetical protein